MENKRTQKAAESEQEAMRWSKFASLKGPGPDPKGARGAWGHCPKCGAVGYCYWDKKTDTRTCMACGHKDNGTIR